MLSRLTVAAIAVPALIIVVAGGVCVRTLAAQGVFSSVPPNTPAQCRIISGTGPEDMAFDSTSGLVFISERDVRKTRNMPSPDDGLYAINAGAPDAKPFKLDTGLADFHPLGISLHRSPEGLTLMAINHRVGKPSSVEIFDVAATPAGAQLFHRITVESALFKSLNDVVAVRSDRFYATNDNGSMTKLGHWLESNLLLPRATLVYYDGEKVALVADGLRTANGVNVSPNGTKLYVAEMNGRQIRTYQRDQLSGALTEPEEGATLPLPINIDNLDVAADGSILVTGHPRIGASRAHWAHTDRPAPSASYAVTTRGGIPVSSILLFADDGRRISASSIAVMAGNSLFVGSAFAPAFLKCSL